MPRSFPSRLFEHPGTLLLLLIPLLLFAQLNGFSQDDAFISFRYALNWYEHGQPTWNPGEQPPIEGYTNFLWVALLRLWFEFSPDALLFVTLSGWVLGGLSLWLTYLLGKSFVPKRPWLPALFLLGAPVPYLASNTVNTDGVLSAMLTLAVACFVKARFAGGGPRWLDAMWLAFGLAFLTKGPPALLPLGVVVAFELWHRNARLLLRPLGLVAFAVVGFTWFGLVIMRHPGLLDYFLGHEVYARIATDTHARNSEWYGAFKIYVPVFLLGLLPWLAVLAKQRLSGAPAPVPSPPMQSRFLWLWLLLPLAVFFLSQSRMYLYVLGLFVPACLLLARRLQDWRIGPGAQTGIALWLLLLLGVKGLAPIQLEGNGKDSRAFADAIKPMLPGHPNQIIFVEDMSRNGLNLYLRTNIKKVSFEAQPKPISDSAYDSSLAQELAQPADQRLFIMKRETEAAFLDGVQKTGRTPHKLGEWIEKKSPSDRDRMIYTLENEFAPH